MIVTGRKITTNSNKKYGIRIIELHSHHKNCSTWLKSGNKNMVGTVCKLDRLHTHYLTSLRRVKSSTLIQFALLHSCVNCIFCIHDCICFIVFIYRIPWFQYPIIYDIRSKPRKIISPTGSKGIV